jgi:hypothetical protein
MVVACPVLWHVLCCGVSCAVVACAVVACVLCCRVLCCGMSCAVVVWLAAVLSWFGWLLCCRGLAGCCAVVVWLAAVLLRWMEAQQVRRPRRPTRTDCARRRMGRASAHAAPYLPTARAAAVLLSKERRTRKQAAEQGAEPRSRGSATHTTRHPPLTQCPP